MEAESIYNQEMRRRRLQEALMQQAVTPQGTQYTGGQYSQAVPYSPLQGLTSIGQALLARQGMKESEKKIQDAIDKQEEKRKRLSEAVMKTAMGTPGAPAVTEPLMGPPEFPEGQRVMQEAVPAVPGDPQKAMLQAASSPETAEMAKYIGLSQKGDRGGYFTPKDVVIDGKTVPMVFDHRKGKWQLDESQGMLSPKYDPKTQAAVSGAKKTAEFEAKRSFGMTGIGETIDEAKKILKTGEPTESGIGKAVDWAARQVGVSTESAKQAAQLEAIGGALTAKMPRMEGPQSDFDRLMYEQMAAKVGDRSVPKEERLAALESMEKIWRKYEHLNAKEKATPKEAAKKVAPPQAVDFLMQNNTPEIRSQFKEKYGYLPDE